MGQIIHSNKHFVGKNATSTAAGALENLVVADAVIAPAASNLFDVVEGSIIKAVHLELWFLHTGNTATTTQVTLIVEKVPAGQDGATVAQLANLQIYDNKKNVLFTFQAILAAQIDGALPVPILRDWFLIPKGKQRFGLGDRIIISFVSLTRAVTTCGMFVYKEYK